MFNFFKKIADPNKRAINLVVPLVDDVFAYEEKYKDVSFEDMKKKVLEMRSELKELIEDIPEEAKVSLSSAKSMDYTSEEAKIKELLHTYIPDLFAILREINNRKFQRPHYRVQLIAAAILAKGNNLVELKTGEGKTQVFHLPAALYGLTGRGSHVITVNDYLARRDGEYAGHAMTDLGITVGIITPQASYRFVPDEELLKIKGEEAEEERKTIDISKLSDMKGINLVECTKTEAYSQDVLYGTNNEFGFDYLRDNMVSEKDQRVQKELYFCIIDEADSILIDEARTPLIISAPAQASNDLYKQFAEISKKLNPEKHFNTDEKARSVTLTEDGVDYVEKILKVNNLWEDYKLAHHLENALKAEVLFAKDDEYIIRNNEVMIVDDFTGRVLPGRRYSEGLHQAIEAKEGVEIQRESRTMATITFQNFFKLYKVLAGGSGTIMTEAEEFFKIYNLDSYEVPTNRPVIRDDKLDVVYKTRLAKFKAVSDEIQRLNKIKQPILVGTASIDDSEYLSRLLDKSGVDHQVLNAKFHEKEAQIVASAGEIGAVTVATNMAGRGTDIPLTDEVIELGGLNVIGTQKHEARRIDNQLRGRSGRQGQPGASQFFVALDDEIMRIQGGEMVSRIMTATKVPDDIPIESRLIGRTIESAQKKMEGHNFDIRKKLVDYDNVMNQQREIFYQKRYSVINSVGPLDASDEEKKEKHKFVEKEIQNMVFDEVDDLVNQHYFEKRPDDVDLEKTLNDYANLANDELINQCIKETYKEENISNLSELKGHLDGAEINDVKDELTKVSRQLINKKLEAFEDNATQIYKVLNLQTMDQLWTDHLDVMADLREGIGLRGYAQRDPLVEYKNEAFNMFDTFINKINSQVAKRILKIQRVVRQQPAQQENLKTNQDQIEDVLTGDREMQSKVADAMTNASKAGAGVSKPTIKTKEPKRNDPCPCGSGLKYKKCGLINSPKHKL